MTDVYKQEETREETIAQRDARLKKSNETARHKEILGLMSQLNPTTGEVALCGDVAGHEFHGNQYTGGGGKMQTGQEKRAEGASNQKEHIEASAYHATRANELRAEGKHEEAAVHDKASEAHDAAAHVYESKTNAHSAAARIASKEAHAIE